MTFANRIPIALTPLVIAAYASADTFEFTSKTAWQSAVVAYDTSTIPFTGFVAGTIVTNQYAGLGVLFSDGNDIIVSGSPFMDNWGLRGGISPLSGGDINLEFTTAQYALALDFPGAAQIELFHGSDLIFTSMQFGGVGGPFFAGVISTEPFDRVRLTNWGSGVVFIDDLHFGVPAPASLALLALAGLWPRSRRRRCGSSGSPWAPHFMRC